jgi:hypothetical protein
MSQSGRAKVPDVIKIRVSASCSAKWFRQNAVTRECVAGVWILERQRTGRSNNCSSKKILSRLTSLFVAKRLHSFQHCTEVAVTGH